VEFLRDARGHVRPAQRDPAHRAEIPQIDLKFFQGRVAMVGPNSNKLSETLGEIPHFIVARYQRATSHQRAVCCTPKEQQVEILLFVLLIVIGDDDAHVWL
jgi:hypothetical protein